MPRTNFKELLDAGVHFGHLKRKWNPSMAPYIFMERNGIHIIDLHKTVAKIDEASNAMKQIAKSGRKILFVATKKQAKEIVSERIQKVNMPYVTERWPGGMLTNFPTIRKAVKKMATIDKMSTDGTYDNLSKREKLQIKRQRAKLEKNLGSIFDLTRLPAALFVVDVSKENIAVREASRLGIPVFGIVDTNSDPSKVDFVIPANDDASKSIALIVDIVAQAVEEGLSERMSEKEKGTDVKEKKPRKEVKVVKQVKPELEEEEKIEEKAVAEEKPIVKKKVAKEAEKTEEKAVEEKIETAEAKEKAPEKKKAEKKAPAKKAAAKKTPVKKAAAKKTTAKKAAVKKDAVKKEDKGE